MTNLSKRSFIGALAGLISIPSARAEETKHGRENMFVARDFHNQIINLDTLTGYTFRNCTFSCCHIYTTKLTGVIFTACNFDNCLTPDLIQLNLICFYCRFEGNYNACPTA